MEEIDGKRMIMPTTPPKDSAPLSTDLTTDEVTTSRAQSYQKPTTTLLIGMEEMIQGGADRILESQAGGSGYLDS